MGRSSNKAFKEEMKMKNLMKNGTIGMLSFSLFLGVGVTTGFTEDGPGVGYGNKEEWKAQKEDWKENKEAWQGKKEEWKAEKKEKLEELKKLREEDPEKFKELMKRKKAKLRE